MAAPSYQVIITCLIFVDFFHIIKTHVNNKILKGIHTLCSVTLKFLQQKRQYFPNFGSWFSYVSSFLSLVNKTRQKR